MKKNFLAGTILLFISIFMILKNTYIASFGKAGVGGILLILLVLSAIFTIIKRSKLSGIIMCFIFVAIILSSLLSMRVIFRPMNIFKTIFVFGLGIIGIYLILKELFFGKISKKIKKNN